MAKVFKGDLVLERDSLFEESIDVRGNIVGKDGKRFDLVVRGDIDAGNINAGNINAGNINAGDIDAGDIDAGNIDAGNINAGDIDAGDIDAGDIDAWNIDAVDIKYYAVCFAYKDIKCNSIKGTRNNSKHFALDGKITTKKEASK